MGNASDERLAQLMRGPFRRPVLRRVFRAMEERYDRDAGAEAMVDFEIGGRRDGGHDHYRLMLEDGSCRVTDWRGDVPDLTITAGAPDFLRLVTGNAQAERLLVQGRLEVGGDVLLAQRLPRLFRRPRRGQGGSGSG